MYMSRVRLKAEGQELDRLARVAGGGGYRVHQALWRLFDTGDGAQREFLYRQESVPGVPSFLLLSQRLPEDRDGLWAVETKEYQPQVRGGQQLAFSLRVNPVVSRRDGDGRQHRHDVVMDRKRILREQGIPAGQAGLVQEAVWAWVESRADKAGFSVIQDSFLAEGYRQHELSKKQKRKIRFSTVDCSGLLVVTDEALFRDALFNGIGPAKAFGCGLLLVRPA